jgi:hypothetical protein
MNLFYLVSIQNAVISDTELLAIGLNTCFTVPFNAFQHLTESITGVKNSYYFSMYMQQSGA